MTIDQIIPQLLETMRRDEPEDYLALLNRRPLPAAGHAALGNPDHPYWSSDECFALYEYLLKWYEGANLEDILNADA